MIGTMHAKDDAVSTGQVPGVTPNHRSTRAVRSPVPSL
jgi:hypothetical protein